VKKNRASKITALAGLTWSVVVSIMLVFLPVYRGVSVDSSGPQSALPTETLIQVNGYRALFLLLIYVLLTAAAAVPILRASHLWGIPRAIVWIAAVMLMIYIVLSGFSIGPFFLPAGLLLIAAAILSEINNRRVSQH
jgi:hypothetical protein